MAFRRKPSRSVKQRVSRRDRHLPSRPGLSPEKPLYRAVEALFQADLSTPAEHASRLARIGKIALDVADARRAVTNGWRRHAVGLQGPGQHGRKLADRGLGIGGDLKNFAAHAFCGGAADDGIGNVVDENEVAGLAAVAIDLPWLAGKGLADEFRHHAALMGRQRAVAIAEAK